MYFFAFHCWFLKGCLGRLRKNQIESSTIWKGSYIECWFKLNLSSWNLPAFIPRGWATFTIIISGSARWWGARARWLTATGAHDAKLMVIYLKIYKKSNEIIIKFPNLRDAKKMQERENRMNFTLGWLREDNHSARIVPPPPPSLFKHL